MLGKLRSLRSLLRYHLNYFRSILHDEKVYPEPLSFRPERFLDAKGSLDPSVQHPEVACFGFGRR